MPIEPLILLIGALSGVTIILFGISAPLTIPLLLLIGYSINEVKGPVLLVDFIYAILASIIYKKAGKINIKISMILTIGVAGALLGVYISYLISEGITTIIAAIFELVMGTYIIYDGAKNGGRITTTTIEKNKYPLLAMVGIAAGFFKGYLGMGWGPVAIPLLVILGLNSYIVVASSLVSRIIISLTSGLTYTVLGYTDANIFTNLLIGGAAGITAATKIKNKLSDDKHRKIIGIFVMILGILILTQI